MTLFIFIFMTTVKLQIKHKGKPTLNAFEAMFKFNPEVLPPYSFIYSSANISGRFHQVQDTASHVLGAVCDSERHGPRARNRDTETVADDNHYSEI